MMVVVPAFAQRYHRKQHAVFAVILRIEPSASQNMPKGIDGKRSVIQGHGGDEKSPCEHLHSVRVPRWQQVMEDNPQNQGAKPQSERRNKVKAIEKHQLWKTDEVLQQMGLGSGIFTGGEPKHVAFPKTLLSRRMRILWLVGKPVMVAMMSGPMQCTPLRCRVADEGEEKLHRAAGFEGSVGKIAVIPAGDGEHADEIQPECDPEGDATEAHPEYRQAHEMNDPEGD